MEEKVIQNLFALIRSSIKGQPMTDEEKAQFSEEMLPELMKLAGKHDLAHLVGYGVYKNELLDKSSPYYAKMQQSQVMAVFRYEKLNYEFERLCDALEKAEIPFIPLKGAVLRKYYPEPWMRTSCDIDVLVHEADLDRAENVLREQCGYERKGTTSHDISLYSSTGQHIELHYTLLEITERNTVSKILASVWDYAIAKSGHIYWFELSNELFYFYHIAHMAKHFKSGGCGIRTFLDLWILDGKGYGKNKDLLKKCGLQQFATVSSKLSECWMNNEEYDALICQMEAYILYGGTYGTVQNKVVLQQQKAGGKFKYLLSKFFQPYDVIKFQYPILMKHRWLTPFMEVRRWCRLAFCGHAKRSINELKYNSSVSSEEAVSMQEFLENIGL